MSFPPFMFCGEIIARNNRLKVALYSGEIPSTTFIERLIVGLASKGVEIVLHGRQSRTVKYESGNVLVTGFRTSFDRVGIFLKYLIQFAFIRPFDLVKLFRSFSTAGTEAKFFHFFVRVAPIIWAKPDIFHLQWAKGVADWIFIKEFGVKLVVSLRGAHINYSPVVDDTLAGDYRRCFVHVDAFHGVSEAICREATNYGASRDRCQVVYSGLPIDDFVFNSVERSSKRPLEIISIGRGHWKKGYRYSIDAANELKERGVDFRYTIVGGDYDELVFQIHQLGLEQEITLMPKIVFDDVKKSILNADLLILPSVEEGIANVVLEAMAIGTIVVATDCGGLSEVIEDGVNGFLVERRSSRSIANGIERVLHLTEHEIVEMKRKARQTIERQHTSAAMIAGMNALYKFTLEEGTVAAQSESGFS